MSTPTNQTPTITQPPPTPASVPNTAPATATAGAPATMNTEMAAVPQAPTPASQPPKAAYTAPAVSGGVKRTHSDMESSGPVPSSVPVGMSTPSPSPLVGVGGVTPQQSTVSQTQPSATQSAANAPAVVAARPVMQPPAKKPNLGPNNNAPPHNFQPTPSALFPQGIHYGQLHQSQQSQSAPSQNVVATPKVQDALGYLEKVKTRFTSAPAVYNQFLDIMKDFKSQNIDTEGVIKRVKSLFKGNRSLILGFNQFLPPGYKIEFEPDRRPTIEFKQAMEYVAKIKNRFREEPYIYAEFLDILHDYQAKRTIDEVYQRVQKLFHGQPDLLDEFKYFLPESAVQNRGGASSSSSASSKPSAAKSGSKPGQSSSKSGTSTQVKRAPGTGTTTTGTSVPPSKGERTTAGAVGVPTSSAAARPPGSSKVPPATTSDKNRKGEPARIPSTKDGKPSKGTSSTAQPSTTGSSAPQSSRTGSAAGPPAGSSDVKSKEGREHRHGHHHASHHAPRVTYPPGSDKELALFERMKNHSSKAQWVQFLKALNLFANDIINRGELIRMVEDIYGDRFGSSGTGDWVDKFKQTIGYDEAEEKQVAAMNQTNYYAFVSSVDFTVCHQVTPSYRELPQLIQVPHASGRTELADDVLNDTCISIPTGSEDFSFKSTRKNVYEENLFKCEDERFELDMLIENNAAAIRVLEPLVEQIASMPPEQAKRVRLPDTIDILHIRAIARVYAEQGYEMVELLNKSPTIATPIILARLKQKDLEWRKIRNEMKSTWRKVNEQNYQRSLDHRSFYFKQEDKKRRSPKALVVELKEVHHAVFGGTGAAPPKPEPVATRSQEGGPPVKKPLPFWGSEDLTGEESLMLRAIRQGQPPNPLYSYCMRFKYGDESIHAQLFDIVAKVGGLILSSEIDQLKVLTFFAGFVAQFFGTAITEAQEAHLVRLGEKVAADDEKRRRELQEPNESMVDKEKTASDALLGVPMQDTPAPVASGGDEKEGQDDMDEDSDTEKPSTAAPAPAAPRSKPGKKKPGKKKATKKKTTAGVAASKQILASPHAKDEEEDLDEDEKPDKKDEEDGYDTGNNARNRAAQQAAHAMNQLNAVRTQLKKLRLANEINADGGHQGPYTSSHPELTLKPVKLHLNSPWMADDKPTPTNPPLRKHGRPSRLFLGSHAYYVFFRVHQFAYERLLTAKTLAHKARRNSSKKKLPATAEERHARFVTMLDQLLEGELETSKFEDECRNLLGASSYVLFTIDKLLEQLVKQTCTLLANDNGLKVLSLYQYENRRVRTCIAQSRKSNPTGPLPIDQLSTLARQYQSNIANLLGDDSACAIEYFDDSHELAIGLTEHLDANNRHVPGDEWNQFVEEYISEIPVGTVRQPYRRRNVNLAIRALTKMLQANMSSKEKSKLKESPDEAAIQQQLFKHTYQQNELASKIDLRSFKINFIEHTADVFIRAAGKTNAKAIAAAKQKHQESQKKKTIKFHSWLSKRLSDLAPLADAQNAAGALGSMLGFGDNTGEVDDGEAPMEVDEGNNADEGFGALTAAADAEDEGEEEGQEEEEEDEKM